MDTCPICDSYHMKLKPDGTGYKCDTCMWEEKRSVSTNPQLSYFTTERLIALFLITVLLWLMAGCASQPVSQAPITEEWTPWCEGRAPIYGDDC
jgi:hypothetical protein